jgi:hypothetical protein
MVWPMMAVIVSLKEQSSSRDIDETISKFRTIIETMSLWVVDAFYDGRDDQRLNTWISIVRNVCGNLPCKENFDLSGPPGSIFLGESPLEDLFLHFEYLFGDFGNDEYQQDGSWRWRRNSIRSVDYAIGNKTSVIERGKYFSANEKLPQLMLPYLDVDMYEILYKRGERARTHYCHQKKVPGLFSKTTNIKPPYDYDIEVVRVGIGVSSKFRCTYSNNLQWGFFSIISKHGDY